MQTATSLDQPRSIGTASITAKRRATGSGIDRLHQSGALKVLFPRNQEHVQGVLLNTSGGVTGGDCFDVTAKTGPEAQMTLTTQAAERVYAAQPGQTGRVRTRLYVAQNSRLNWLPQETILYNNAHLDRALRVDLEPDATFLMVEPVLFGRKAMGEDVDNLSFSDRIHIFRGTAPLYLDAVHLEGNVAAELNRPAVAAGARAMASLVWVAKQAAGFIDRVRALITPRGGASLLRKDVLAMRILADDGYDLRRSLLPLLDLLSENTLPVSWRL